MGKTVKKLTNKISPPLPIFESLHMGSPGQGVAQQRLGLRNYLHLAGGGKGQRSKPAMLHWWILPEFWGAEKH